MKNIRKKYLLFFCILVSFIYLLHPGRNAPNFYSYISEEDIETSLYAATNVNLTVNLVNPYCHYQDILKDSTRLSVKLNEINLNPDVEVLKGGEYYNKQCNPKYSVAIIVPYRDRANQLHNFLIYMHKFLHKQKLHYRIYVVEQLDKKSFNRASLLNVGARQAIKDGFPCLILHDVDLLPIRANNIYACTLQPRHMSSNVNIFRFNLPYTTIFGGAVAISSKQFSEVNGMSNMFFGWGAEDDDFYERITSAGLELWRFPPYISEYYMMHHKASNKKYENKALLGSAANRMQHDGLKTLQLSAETLSIHPLFTHIIVEF